MSQSATHSAASAGEALSASSLIANPRIDAAVATMVEELRGVQARLTGARPPKAELAETFRSWLDRNAAVRGRASWYPYVGSGLGNGPLVELLDGSVK